MSCRCVGWVGMLGGDKTQQSQYIGILEVGC